MYQVKSNLPQLVQDALSEAEDFIRGFEGDEMQDGLPEKILDEIAVARAPWREPRHPGDHILQQYLTKGDDIGMVTVQDYSGCCKPGHELRVGSFLPGDVECPPGDTPKTWPERKEYVADKAKALPLFERYVVDAIKAGWLLVEN